LADLKPFVMEHAVDEIYCPKRNFKRNLKDLIDFADENNKTIKFIPIKEIFSRNLKLITMNFSLFYL
jgi:putative colanic acid biosynthesis UDP-glucose lipid carrier transferase